MTNTRKPVDKLNGYDSREAVWAAIRRLKSFTVRELQMETTMAVDSVRDYCIGLANAGYIKKVGNRNIRKGKTLGCISIVWELVRDMGEIAPRVRRDGTPVMQGLGREQMWRTMRILKIFTVPELIVTASTEECLIKQSSGADYCKHLCRAGYLIKLPNRRYRFQPSQYTGPRPPMIQRTKQVYDANLKKVVWSSTGGVNHGK